MPILLVLMLMQASPGALSPLPSTTAAAAPSPAAAPKRICRAVVPTGSIMAVRVCDSPANWARYQRDNEAGADNFASHKHAGMCDGPCNGASSPVTR